MSTYLHAAKMRLVLAAKEKEMPKKNTRRIGAIINNAIADLDEILLSNDINSLPDGPIKIAYESILTWATASMDKVQDEKEATKLAASIRGIVSKVRKPMENLSKMNNAIIDLEESILATLDSYGIKHESPKTKEPETKKKPKAGAPEKETKEPPSKAKGK